MEEHWVIFSKKGCPHCIDTKNELYERMKGQNSVLVDIIPEEKYGQYKVFSSNMTTWPRIFLIKECSRKCNPEKRNCIGECKNILIGGHSDLQNYLKPTTS